MRETRYNLDSVKNDVRAFFTDDAHWAYQYGSKAVYCSKDSVFYKKQIQVIFEDKYQHDVTGKAVNELIKEGFLIPHPVTFGKDLHAIFVYRHNVRYVIREIDGRASIIARFSDDDVNDGVGRYAQILFSHMFKRHQFEIIGRNTNKFGGKEWNRTKKDLDFIIQRDGISYGVEIKNTFDYMPQDEFEEKLEMCDFLGLSPLFPLRCPSELQYAQMKGVDGLALKFKARIFPPGFQTLVTDIWNNFRLPITIWDDIPQRIETIFLDHHKQNINRQ